MIGISDKTTISKLSLEWFEAEELGKIRMPHLETDEKVICCYDLGLKEKFIICETLEDMQELFTIYTEGKAIRINWYIDKSRFSAAAVMIRNIIDP